MKSGAGKRKGSVYERWGNGQLSLWLTGDRDDKQLIRSVLSGGWRAGQQDGFRHVGDSAPNGPFGEAFRRRFAVEFKHHRIIDLYHVWSRKSGLLTTWWKKLLAEVDVANGIESSRPGTLREQDLQPLLIFRANTKPDVVGFRSSYLEGLQYNSHDTAITEWITQAPFVTFTALGLSLLPFHLLVECPPQWFVPGLPAQWEE